MNRVTNAAVCFQMKVGTRCKRAPDLKLELAWTVDTRCKRATRKKWLLLVELPTVETVGYVLFRCSQIFIGRAMMRRVTKATICFQM